jgi:hypothetical protein
LSTCKNSQDELSEETIEQRVRSRRGSSNLVYRTVEGLNLRKEARPAAVLIPMVCDGGYWHVLFIRRSDTLPEHKGQVAFPGGAFDLFNGELLWGVSARIMVEFLAVLGL